ncbi:hypothetical protein [Micromonospora sp. KC721]|uniref:hypothetical protein n=1 Tax=Micromonospora sp. KC721 TaxID=2530380 RepID=UPI00104344B6|nr:hypothetical protein [Micromonospora sp. KC721]TDB71316.1 hypothetical protein E1182_25395 [Micromonospora sp. KC721]
MKKVTGASRDRITAVLASVALALGFASWGSPAEAANGRHTLAVRVAWNVKAVQVAIVGQAYRCVALPAKDPSQTYQWFNTGLTYNDGTELRVNMYLSSNCQGDSNYWGGKRVTVSSDNLTYFWLDMAR